MTSRDRDMLRGLGIRVAEEAASDRMARLRTAWTRLHDLDPIRPMFLFETDTILDFVPESELECVDPAARAMERVLRHDLKHRQWIDDDKVLEPVAWVECPIRSSGFGVEIHTVTTHDSIAYLYDYPIRDVADLARLRPVTWTADRAAADRTAEEMRDVFRGLLDVGVRGPAFHLPQLTGNLYRLIGMDRMYEWIYDHPEALAALCEYLADWYWGFLDWLEAEGLLFQNTTNVLVGSGSYGYASSLPACRLPAVAARSADIWGWIESQETATIDPDSFYTLFLPAMARIASRFGLVYYGCCEQLHDRFPRILSAIPRIRCVSISPWSDQRVMDDLLGGDRVFSRKMPPMFISGESPDLSGLSADVADTLRIRQSRPTEFIYRDVYDIRNELPRLTEFGQRMRALTGF